MEPALALEDVTLGIGGRTIVQDLTLEVGRGEIVALVGESGAGKSLTGLGIIGLLPAGGWLRGALHLGGSRFDPMDERRMPGLRGSRIGMVFQDPVAALDPAMSIGDQMIETLRHHRRLPRAEARIAAIDLLQAAGIPEAAQRLGQHGFQLSGGLCQRVMIALALAGGPELLIADEPTAALDSATQAEILALLRRLADTRGLGILLVSHDLDALAGHADRIAVLYAGSCVETGAARRILSAPRHPYTAALVACRLDPARAPGTPLPGIEGVAPPAGAPVAGCVFAPRCPLAMPRCAAEPPLWAGDRADGSACWLETGG